MQTLHTFGCSVTQGMALPDVVKPLSDQALATLRRNPVWADVHVLAPSAYAWPSKLAALLGTAVRNHAMRGACWQQIARQCAVAASSIQPGDTVVVMWTFFSRFSLQWPSMISNPINAQVFSHNSIPNDELTQKILDLKLAPGPAPTYETITYKHKDAIKQFINIEQFINRNTGLDGADDPAHEKYKSLQKWIQHASKTVYTDPKHLYDRYYNNLVLQQMTHGFLRSTGARVIHLSVETESARSQLETARRDLEKNLQSPQHIPHINDWYTVPVDHICCYAIWNENIPLAGDHTHPSEQHHENFAEEVYTCYFQDTHPR